MSCRPCPAASAGLDQATALWPNRNRASDGICGDAAHAARDSDHNPDSRGLAHAFDLTHDPAHGCDAHRLADEARIRALRAQEPRLKYVISNRRIASPSSGWNWTRYTGSNPHTQHAHFSIYTAHENDTSPWYAGGEGDEDMPLSEGDLFKIGVIVKKSIADDVTPELERIDRKVTRSRGILRAVASKLGLTKKEIDTAAESATE